MTEAQLEAMIDKKVQRALQTDPRYRYAANAEAQAQAEEEIEQEVIAAMRAALASLRWQA